MKKLQLIIIILSFILAFSGCKELNNESYNYEQDRSMYINNDLTEKTNPKLSKEVSETDLLDQTKQDTVKIIKKDDWEYDSTTSAEDMHNQFTPTSKPISRDRVGSSRQSTSTSLNSQSGKKNLGGVYSDDFEVVEGELGFSVGGAKDINNFRENIKNNYMPVKEDITHEGIFYDYFFDNNITKKATHLFEPSYTSLKNRNPLTNEEELYLSLALNSNLTEASFKRKKLNLTIVLDISGSMGSSFDNYYYDGKSRKEYEDNFDKRSKMEIAKECIIDLTKHLKSGDRLAIVLFDNSPYLAKPFNLIESTDMEAIRNHVSEINYRGGTNMYAGIQTASELYNKLPEYDSAEYDNRIIFLTDAMPNAAVTNENSLWGVIKVNAEKKIYTTFIGVGIDLNNELINYITKTSGANYYSVHNAQEFKKRMDTQFDFMVTPLVFDLTLHLDSDNYDIEAVYGSPEANQATGEIMKINTLFPSESSDGKTRGGIILVKLKQTGKNSKAKLTCNYKDRNGIPFNISENIEFSSKMRGSDNGIRKAVLLSRYVNLMHDWINDKTSIEANDQQDDWQYNKQEAKRIQQKRRRGRWERTSQNLAVTSYYKEQFSEFIKYFGKEATEIKDEDLRKELDILEKLKDYKN